MVIPFAIYEIQSTGTMKEGTKASPPIPPLHLAIMTYYLFGGYRIWGRPQRRG